ncbi:lysozyme inhibitor LprI family protein [Pseudoduganella lutea]|nr:lysozyme inhibitor LprI family protein [Pseudoduganella lutea]
MRAVSLLLAGVLLAAGAHARAWEAPAACPANVSDADLPSIFAGHEGCNPIGKYYGALRSARPDWQAVHRCAVQDRNDAVLMMLHANGHGVPRDVDRAIGHACRVDGAKAELEGRIAHLQQIKAGKDNEPFDLCDDITSGMMMGFCAGIEEDGDSAERHAALARLGASFTAAQQARFAALRKATDAFAENVGRLETDLSGTARAAMVIGAESAVQDALLADLRAAESGKLPSATEAAFATADKALNDVYRKVMALPADAEGRIGYSTVTKPDIRMTQRSWIAYRDAWTAFAQARYPSVPAAAWKARLTTRRTASLQEWLD